MAEFYFMVSLVFIRVCGTISVTVPHTRIRNDADQVGSFL